VRPYQRRGWDLVAVHRDVMLERRRINLRSPSFGRDAIPMRHALELEPRLASVDGC